MQDNKTYALKHIEISDEVLFFLTPAKADIPYSRCDAFHDLVVRATSSSGQITCKGTELNLMPGEFVVTVSELSDLWGWERRTVRNFIRNLECMDMLQVIPHMKFYQVDMVALRFKRLGEANPMLAVLSARGKFSNDPLGDFLNDPDNAKLLGNAPSGSSLTNPFTDSLGQELYTAKQRMEVATALLSSQSRIGLQFLLSLYTPKVEKSMLDAFYKRFGGDGEAFAKILNGLAEVLDSSSLANARSALADIFEKASEALSAASRDVQAEDSIPKLPKAKRTRKTKPKQ